MTSDESTETGVILDLNTVDRKHRIVKAAKTDKVYANTALVLLNKLFISLRLIQSHNRNVDLVARTRSGILWNNGR